MNRPPFPTIIQGGMGAGVSGWRLARAVAQAGQLGVVSGTALETILVRRLQNGDAGGELRRALAHLPIPGIANDILDRYFLPDGRGPGEGYRLLPMYSLNPPTALLELTVAANFVEVWLAKEGHTGLVGINYLEKIQLPNLASLYGAMLAGVDYVLMGAGIPREIPGVLDRLSQHQPAQLTVDLPGRRMAEPTVIHFDPASLWPAVSTRDATMNSDPFRASLVRPTFLAIVSSEALAQILVRKATGRVDGFVVEGPTAGGHNAPPRGTMTLNPRGEPVYGSRDVAKLDVLRSLDRPFWLAGGYAHPDKLREALAAGATGIQVGTAFAFCRESGIDPGLKRRVLDQVRHGVAQVRTDPRASPTGYPFKIVDLEASMSDEKHYAQRPRRCDLGYLREMYITAEGAVGFRCPSESLEGYTRKGGDPIATDGRKCLCNGLLATIGLGQTLVGGMTEPPIVTAGDDLPALAQFLSADGDDYTAAEVLAFLGAGLPSVV